MKTNRLTMLCISLLFLLSSCEKMVENEPQDKSFLQNEWKVQSVTNKGKHFAVPSNHTFFREEAYILKFANDSCFVMNTSVNYAGGKYQIVSDDDIVITDYHEWTEVAGSYGNFDNQLISVFNGEMSYSYTKNKLIFRGDKNKEIVFVKQ